MKSKNLLMLLSAGAILIVPMFLRRRMRVHRQLYIEADPETIFPLINDLRNWPLWREWKDASDGMHYSYSGPPAGIGARQEFTIGGRSGISTVVDSRPPESVTYQIDVDDGRRRVEGHFTLRPFRTGTLVRWVSKWNGNPVPHGRVRDLLSMAMAARRMHASLLKLKRLSERGGLPAEQTIGGNGD